MTMPDERYRAVLKTSRFLFDIVAGFYGNNLPKDLQERARDCLRHYPGEFYMEEVAETSEHFDKVDYNVWER